MCRVADDCVSRACLASRCAAPGANDGVMNGDESDVDCGGSRAPGCGEGGRCTVGADCRSLVCGEGGACSRAPSCARRAGGETCGRGEVGSAAAAHESCCATAPVPGSRTRLGKYGVTAGRMRTFLEAVSGNVRGLVRGLRTRGPLPFGAILPPAWDVYLPTSLEGDTSPSELSEAGLGGGAPIPGLYTSAYRHVSGYIFRDNEQVLTGCTNGAPGTHTVFVPDEAESRLFGDVPHEVPRELVDTKGANCTSYLLAQAFCLWDGGRLQTREELEAAWGPATYPWGDAPWPFGPGSGTYFGNRFPWATDASLRASGSPFAPGPMQSLEMAAFSYSYEYPALTSTDYAVFIPAPGRMRGRGAYGHSLTDGLMELTGSPVDGVVTESPFTTRFHWGPNGSFEGHGLGFRHASHAVNKYGKLGFRCAYPER